MKCRSLTKWLGAAALLSVAGTVAAQDRAAWVDPHAGLVPDEVVQNGYRRVHRTEVQQVTPEDLAELVAAGKEFELDPATGGIIRHTFTDYLPQGWLMEPPADGSRVDSYGHPIVNEAQGLPAWSQRSVDALRAEIARAAAIVSERRSTGGETQEVEAWLGNLIGQAIARDINIDTVLSIDTSPLVTGVVAHEVVNYLHFYENLRFTNQSVMGYRYTPTQYTARVSAFLASQGTTLAQVQAIESSPMSDRGVACYSTTAFARGMTSLVTPTVLWNASGTDDGSSDVPTGFSMFSFQDCEDPDNNDSVRVSTNGYLSFFQQGGGALDGTDFSNDAIPTTGVDPNGWVGTFWDDLWVAPAQGEADVVSYLTEGAVGSRVLTVEYRSMSHLGAGTSEFYWFQMKLYETSSVVQLHFFSPAGWTNSGDESATIGMEDFDGTQGNCGPNCGNTNADRAPDNYSFEYFRPGNDNCAGAFSVADGSIISGDLSRASDDGDVGCTSFTYNRDVWYSFVAPCAGDLVVNMCGSFDGGGVDTVISAHSACPGTAANQLACNDQFGGAGCSGNDSQITVPMTDGQEVFIRISHWGSSTALFQDGSFTGTVTFNETGAAPANDSSATPIILTGSASGLQDLGCASNDGNTTCGASTGNRDLWYRFDAICSGTLTVHTDGSNTLSGIDTVLSAHSAVPGTPGNTITCNDDFGDLDSNIVVAMTAGQSVYIRASHFGSRVADGRFNINFGWVVSASVPTNDTCVGAIALACNQSVVGDTCGATDDDADVADACGTGAVNSGVWYTVIGNGAEFGASTCSADTNFDTKMSVYTGTCGALVCVAGNDDIASCPASPASSRVTWLSTPGVRYYIFVQGFGAAVGTYRLTIVNNGLPTNDDCSGALNAVSGGSYVGNLWCATPDGASTCSATAGNRSVWYRFVAPSDGNLIVDTCGSRASGPGVGTDTVISAFAGGCGGPSVLCNDDGAPGCNIRDSQISGPMSAGQVVLVRLTHFGVVDDPTWLANGNYVINFTFGGCDSIDWNGDGLFPDTQDIADFISVFGGGFCAAPNPPLCNTDIDYNNDGLFPDTDDIAAFIRVFSGGPCF
ncbi:MAG TPA: hypothetical protein VHN77_06990 [Phycisphaerales bacterium]|nr:hypothetical protein [Phycisphaerales bacterium]